MGQVTAQEIAQKLISADDPMSFIKANLEKNSAKLQGTPPAQVPQTPTQQTLSSVLNPEPQVETALVVENPLEKVITEPEEEIEPQKEEAAIISDEMTPATLLDQVKKKPTKEDSVKEAKKKITELYKTVEEKESRLASLEETVKKYEKGEILPDIVKEKDEKIEELSFYESLYNVKNSPQYQKEVVAPMTELQTKAQALAKDYGVNPQVLNEALKIQNKRDRNAYLRNYFDDVGTIEVKELLEDITSLEKKALEIESKPRESLAEMQRRYEESQREQEIRRVESLKVTANSSWKETLTELTSTGKYPELTLTGDKNVDSIVKENIEEAAREFGKFISLLGVKKVSDLPLDAAKILAKRFLLSQAASIAMASRNHHYERAETIEKEAKEMINISRPQIGRSVAFSNVTQSPQPQRTQKTEKDLQDTGRRLIESIISRK